MKTAVVYYSKHHGNTKKLLDAIKSASSDEITLFDVTKTPPENLEEYDLIGFASGIYYSQISEERSGICQKPYAQWEKGVSHLHLRGQEGRIYKGNPRSAGRYQRQHSRRIWLSGLRHLRTV